MIIHIEVKNRVATYRFLGSDPVCGSNNDMVKFHFDEEWKNVPIKTARFVWGGRYYDQEFTGDMCRVPMFVNLTRVWIGVYAGEPVEEEPAWATTKAEVPYRLSVRCGYQPAQPESGNGYTNEARGYSVESQAAAEIAVAAAGRTEQLAKNIQTKVDQISEEFQTQVDQISEEFHGELDQLDQKIASAGGLQEAGRLSLRIYLREISDEDGIYRNVWTFGEGLADYLNGSVLLSYMGEGVISPVYLSHATAVKNLMRCPVTRIMIEHCDYVGVMTEKILYDGLRGAEYWGDIDIPYDGSTCRLCDTEWSSKGARLIVSDNLSAPNVGAGPTAMFFQFPSELNEMASTIQIYPDNEEHYLIFTIIGYR